MRALLIVLPILAFLLLLLFAKLRFSLSYGEGLSLSVRYLFLRFSLYPRKRKLKPKKKKKKKEKREISTQDTAKKAKPDTIITAKDIDGCIVMINGKAAKKNRTNHREDV